MCLLLVEKAITNTNTAKQFNTVNAFHGIPWSVDVNNNLKITASAQAFLRAPREK